MDNTRRKAVFNPLSAGANRHIYSINDLVPANVKFLIVPDDSMSGSMIRCGSLIAVELGAAVIPNYIYLVHYRGQQLLRKIGSVNGQKALMPSNPNWSSEVVGDSEELVIMGKVIFSFYFHTHITDKIEKVLRNLTGKDYDD